MYALERLTTPLQYACSFGLYETVHRLLQEGADPNLLPQGVERDPTTNYGELPLDIVLNPKLHNIGLFQEGLHCAKKFTNADVDYTKCLHLLLQNRADPGPDPEKLGKGGRKRPTPIFQAVRNVETLKVFLEFAKNNIRVLNQTNKSGHTVLNMAVIDYKDDETIKMLIDAGINQHAGTESPIASAIRCKNYKALRFLLECEVDLEMQQDIYESPIMFALSYKDPQLLV